MIAARLRLLMGTLAAFVALAVPAPAGAVGAEAVGANVKEDLVCAVTVSSPNGIELVAEGILSCNRALGTPVTASIEVCAQNFAGFITGAPWRMAWNAIDGCTTRSGDFDGLTPVRVRDSIPCGSTPLYRGTVKATVAGIPTVMRDESEPRPAIACG